MKQSAAKSLGVAALGVAFAAAGAGAAHAAPVGPNVPAALDVLTSTVPVEEVARTLPAGAPEAVSAGKSAISAMAAADAEQAKPAAGSADPVRSLLGGLPASALPLNGTLPVQGLPLNGSLPTDGLPLAGLPIG